MIDKKKRWPRPLGAMARKGFIGQVLDDIGPETEADEAAIAIQVLTLAGNLVGRNPYLSLGRIIFRPNIFSVIVGDSAKARKGTSLKVARDLFLKTDQEWLNKRNGKGVASGEAIVQILRDSNEENIADKRLVIIEDEFGELLEKIKRKGCVISTTMRSLWDGERISNLTKGSRETVTNPHVSMIGHITQTELQEKITFNDLRNGFANRVIWIACQRGGVLPLGDNLSQKKIDYFQNYLSEVHKEHSKSCEFKLDSDAQAFWDPLYRSIAKEIHPGIFGAVTARADAQILRLALILAVLNRKRSVSIDELATALEIWRYAEDSCGFIFGKSTGNKIADQIGEFIENAGIDGLTRTEIHHKLNRNCSSERIDQALSLLVQAKKVSEHPNPGSPSRWVDLQFSNSTNFTNSLNSYNSLGGEHGR